MELRNFRCRNDNPLVLVFPPHGTGLSWWKPVYGHYRHSTLFNERQSRANKLPVSICVCADLRASRDVESISGGLPYGASADGGAVGSARSRTTSCACFGNVACNCGGPRSTASSQFQRFLSI